MSQSSLHGRVEAPRDRERLALRVERLVHRRCRPESWVAPFASELAQVLFSPLPHRDRGEEARATRLAGVPGARRSHAAPPWEGPSLGIRERGCPGSCSIPVCSSSFAQAGDTPSNGVAGEQSFISPSKRLAWRDVPRRWRRGVDRLARLLVESRAGFAARRRAARSMPNRILAIARRRIRRSS